MMKHRGYIAKVEYDNEDRIFLGHLAGIKDIVGFHGSSVDELETAFHEAVDEYIAISEKTGRPVQRPYSGNLMLRISPEVHAAAATAAEAKGKSLNQWVKNSSQ
ncbi:MULTISPECIES: type II toxin-antitoxin system HicB family antitoxin [unclassified Endozoicomonas]|uniref:type II toxin-antitoxin system HicB family antitoxin n=2 Tax=Endozoicomonas TaxID=305899 RepID=UPI002147E711|nr:MULTISPECIES: type II toxin-antitoxin system HicB family antitoxin [unclassified Endozoicomonas]